MKILTKEHIIKFGFNNDIKFQLYKNDSMYSIGERGTHGYFIDFIIMFHNFGFDICIEMASMESIVNIGRFKYEHELKNVVKSIMLKKLKYYDK